MFESMKALADALQEQYASLASAGPDTMSLDERAERLADCQRAINSLSAIQDLDMARLAATERVPCEDGTSRDVMHTLGSMRLDAAALTSGSLQVSDAVARRRVDNAVWLCTVGRAALDAKGEGRLDEFRASILAEELADADADTTTAVLERIDDDLGEETPGLLRRRTRRVLSRIDPDVVHRKAAAATSERRLERWAGEPGMDRWYASLPADQAGAAFAAIDARAHERLAEGLSPTIDNARADALIDLILSNCVASVGVQFAVPTTLLLESAVDETEAAAMDTADLIAVEGLSATGPVQLRRSSLQSLVDRLMTALLGPVGPEAAAGRSAHPTATLLGCNPATGAAATVPVDPTVLSRRASSPALASTAHDAPAALKALVRTRDRACRFPGCTINARFCDLDHVIAWPAGPTAAHNLICLCRRHHRIKQSQGWSIALHSDGRVTWADPCGRVRTTDPVDHLDLEPPSQLKRPAPSPPALPPTPPLAEPTPPVCRFRSPDYFSRVEYALEHHLKRAERARRRAQHRPSVRVIHVETPPF